MLYDTSSLIFLSTLSLRRATVCYRDYPAIMEFLSTLSLRRATASASASGNWIRISIHALLAESDLPLRRQAVRTELFLSTLSLRRATAPPYNLMIHHGKFLSTLSLRRATEQSSSYSAYLEISIHALLAESDLIDEIQLEFNSLISIHALLAESDRVNEDRYGQQL